MAAILGFVAVDAAALAAPSLFALRGSGIAGLWRHGGVFPAGPAGCAGAPPFAMSSYGAAEVIGLVAA